MSTGCEAVGASRVLRKQTAESPVGLRVEGHHSFLCQAPRGRLAGGGALGAMGQPLLQGRDNRAVFLGIFLQESHSGQNLKLHRCSIDAVGRQGATSPGNAGRQGRGGCRPRPGAAPACRRCSPRAFPRFRRSPRARWRCQRSNAPPHQREHVALARGERRRAVGAAARRIPRVQERHPQTARLTGTKRTTCTTA